MRGATYSEYYVLTSYGGEYFVGVEKGIYYLYSPYRKSWVKMDSKMQELYSEETKRAVIPKEAVNKRIDYENDAWKVRGYSKPGGIRLLEEYSKHPEWMPIVDLVWQHRWITADMKRCNAGWDAGFIEPGRPFYIEYLGFKPTEIDSLQVYIPKQGWEDKRGWDIHIALEELGLYNTSIVDHMVVLESYKDRTGKEFWQLLELCSKNGPRMSKCFGVISYEDLNLFNWERNTKKLEKSGISKIS